MTASRSAECGCQETGSILHGTSRRHRCRLKFVPIRHLKITTNPFSSSPYF